MNNIEKDIPVSPTPSVVAPPSNASLPERRQSMQVPPEAAAGARAVLDSLAPFLRRFKPDDIIDTRQHSADFIETRAEYIALRLRFMAIFYAIFVPLWIPVDYLLLRPEHFNAITIARIMLAGLLLTLGLFTLRKHTSKEVHVVLALTIAAPCIFYVAALLVLNQGVAEPPPAGYSFMPFLMVAMLGVFPLTIAWGVALTAMIVVIHLGLAASLGQLMTAETVDKLWLFIMFGGISLWIQSAQLLMLMKLYRESTQDPLTGLINRRVLMKRLTREIADVRRGKPPFCILMFDLDRFKRINDNYGHLTGDEVLKTTANILQSGVREHDIVARFGGEEFVAVLPDSNSVEAIAVAERIRQSVHDAQVAAPDSQFLQLSTSIGVTEYEAGETIEVMLNRVDGSLFRAKVLGRNRVVHSQSDHREEA